MLILGLSLALGLEYGGIWLFLYLADTARNTGILILSKAGAWVCFMAIVATCAASLLR